MLEKRWDPVQVSNTNVHDHDRLATAQARHMNSSPSKQQKRSSNLKSNKHKSNPTT